MTELAFSAALEDGATVAMPATPDENPSSEMIAPEPRDPTSGASESRTALGEPAPVDHLNLANAGTDTDAQSSAIERAVAELCAPLSDTDPCGPDLDLAGDADYLNFFAQTEGILPTSFFSSEDGKPFDRSSVDLPGQLDAIGPLWARSRDLRLLVMRARLLILNRDLGGFAVAIAAVAQWLDKFWDDVHPHVAGDDFGARVAALSALDLPTVVFPLQYAPLCEGHRTGAVTYRAWMIAVGEVKPRAGEQKHPSAALTEAVAEVAPAALAETRRYIAMLKASLGRIRDIFMIKGSPLGLENLTALVDRLQGFIDPRAALGEETAARSAGGHDVSAIATDRSAGALLDGAPASLAEAQEALAAIAGYYSRSEPSSPILPLVRQAHQLIGKSFFEVMTILVPAQMERAAFQIGADQFFELPVGRLSERTEASSPLSDDAGPPPEDGHSPRYPIESRAQAMALLDQVQRFFRHAEPSSPVPMLCDRARALAERDFMGVLREVLPKSSLKTFRTED